MRGAWEAIRLSQLYFLGKSIWLEGDALYLLVIQDLIAISRSLEPSVLLEDTIGMIGIMEIHKITHTHREGNQCADWLMRWIQERGFDMVMVDSFPL